MRWPVALAPARRLDALPHEAVAGRALTAGMAVVPADLRRRAGPGDRPTIAIALADVHVAVEAGDRVDLWAAGGDALLAADAQPARRVASGAIITVADESSITVAIRPAEVAAVAAAVAGTTVVPVAVG